MEEHITTINRVTCQLLAAELEAFLRPFAEARGLTVAIRGGSFQSTQYRPKMTFSVVASADGRSGAQVEFDSLCRYYGLTPDMFGMTFTYRGERYRIDGIAPRSRKAPIIGTRRGVGTSNDGKMFRFPASVILAPGANLARVEVVEVAR